MTGPEHYKEAERLLAEAEGLLRPGTPIANYTARVDAAQVHAMLALTAATAMANTGEMTILDGDSWTQAVSAWKPREADI